MSPAKREAPLTTPAVENCPECGALRVAGLDCWGQLGALIAWEWQGPTLMAQHFLTIAAYNLQHPAQFTEEAMVGLRQQPIEHLDNGLPVHKIRRRISRLAAGKTRVRRPPTEQQPERRHWSRTIADVYLPDQPAGAAERVKAWAAAIRAELPP